MGQITLYGLIMPSATHIAVCTDNQVIGFCYKEGTKEENDKEVVDMLTKRGLTLDHIEERKTYWWLPLDSYNQPNGTTEPISLFPIDYQTLKSERMELTYPYWWIYDNEESAMNRALD